VRTAIIISILFHLSVFFVSTRIVKFSRVRYIPRQVYAVRLVSSEPAAEPPKQSESPKAKQPEEKIEEVKKPPPEEVVPPAPKKKPVKQKPKQKVVPSSEVKKEKAVEKDSKPSEQTEQVDTPSTGDISLDVADFPFGYYLLTMKRKIAAHWEVPQTLQREPLVCFVYFRIARNGNIQSSEIEQSSGSFLFDQAALRAVIQASPLPKLPGEFRDDYLGVHFSFAYEER